MTPGLPKWSTLARYSVVRSFLDLACKSKVENSTDTIYRSWNESKSRHIIFRWNGRTNLLAKFHLLHQQGIWTYIYSGNELNKFTDNINQQQLAFIAHPILNYSNQQEVRVFFPVWTLYNHSTSTPPFYFYLILARFLGQIVFQKQDGY